MGTSGNEWGRAAAPWQSGARERGGETVRRLEFDRSVRQAALDELALLWAISSLSSLDVIVLMMPHDPQNVQVCKMLANATLLPVIHQRQTTNPQLLVRT